MFDQKCLAHLCLLCQAKSYPSTDLLLSFFLALVLGNKLLHDLICYIKHPMYGTNYSQFKCDVYAHGKATSATYVLLIMYTPFYMLYINCLRVYRPRHVFIIFLHIRFNIAHTCAPRCVMHLCHLYCCFLSREHLLVYYAL